MVNITIEIPDERLTQLGATPDERIRFILEAVAVEGVRTGRLWKPQAAALLGMNRVEFLALLSERKVPDGIEPEAIKESYHAFKRIFGQPKVPPKRG